MASSTGVVDALIVESCRPTLEKPNAYRRNMPETAGVVVVVGIKRADGLNSTAAKGTAKRGRYYTFAIGVFSSIVSIQASQPPNVDSIPKRLMQITD